MCNGANQTIVDEVIQEKVKAGEAFTAWDVTQEARNRGADEQHWQLKAAVHGAWSWLNSQENYRRQVIQLPSVSIDPWLYYPDGFDPQTYIDSVTASQGETATIVLDENHYGTDDDSAGQGVAVAPAPSATVSRNGVRTIARNGRLMVPTAKVRQLLLLTGHTAHVYTNGNTLYIASPLSHIDAAWTKVGTQRVTTHDRLYLQPRFLEALDPTSNRFATQVNGDHIEVSQA